MSLRLDLGLQIQKTEVKCQFELRVNGLDDVYISGRNTSI